jgi:hypothetical protein
VNYLVPVATDTLQKVLLPVAMVFDKGGWLNSHEQQDVLHIVFHNSEESQMQGPPVRSRYALSALLACCGQLPHRDPIWPSLNP